MLTWLRAADWYLVGLGIVVGSLTYPSFGLHRHSFDTTHRHHMAVIGWIVGPAWFVQGVGCAWLLWQPLAIHTIAHDVACALAVALTVVFAVPAHNTLSRGFHRAAWITLQRAHWLRTMCWLTAAVLVTA